MAPRGQDAVRPSARPPRRRRGLRRWVTLGVGLFLASAVALALPSLAPDAQAAPGDAFDPSQPLVVISAGKNNWNVPIHDSTLPGVGTALFQLDNQVSGAASTLLAAPNGSNFNAVAFHEPSGFIFAMKNNFGATANNRDDTTLLKIGQNNEIVESHDIVGLPTPQAEGGGGQQFPDFNQATFGEGATENIYYVKIAADSVARMYAVDVTSSNWQSIQTLNLSARLPDVADLVYKDGYLWGFAARNGVASDVFRITLPSFVGGTTANATVTGFDSGIVWESTNTLGASWVYGNGLVGIAQNSGRGYVVDIVDGSSASPQFVLRQKFDVLGGSFDNVDATSIPGGPIDLSVTKAGPAYYQPGGQYSYSITVRNENPTLTSTGGRVEDTLPPGVTPGVLPTGCTFTAGVVTCIVPALAPLAITSISLPVTIVAGTSGVLTNTVTVFGNEADPNPDNDTATWDSLPLPVGCVPDVLFGLGSDGALSVIRATDGHSTQFGSTGGASVDGLGISPDTTRAYSVTTAASAHTVYTYFTASTPAVATAVTSTGLLPSVNGIVLTGGAVNPVDSAYYVGGYHPGSGRYLVYRFDSATATLASQFSVAVASGAAGGTVEGDLSFDTQGRAYIAISGGTTGTSDGTGNQLLIVDMPPTDGSAAVVRVAANLAEAATVYGGAAFASDGYLYGAFGAGGSQLVRVDPNSGQAAAPTAITDSAGLAVQLTDLASCAYPSTITLQKDVASRYSPDDQFSLTLAGGGATATAETSGATTGPQTDAASTAGAIIAVPGREYTVDEASAAGVGLDYYTSTWQCSDEADASVASGDGATGAVTAPTVGSSGAHVTCVFVNTPVAAWSLFKDALNGSDVLAQGATVQPGDTITYRVTFENQSATPIDQVVLTDDLSGALNNAQFVSGSAKVSIRNGSVWSLFDVPDPSGTILTFGPGTLPANGTAILTYQITVNQDASGVELRNVVTATSTTSPPAPCDTACATRQVTPLTVGVQVLKVGEDINNDVVPMDGSQWAIYSTATGGTAVVNPIPPVEDAGSPVVGLFRVSMLDPGSYWLEETRGLEGFQLLAQRVPFTVSATGVITLDGPAPDNISVITLNGSQTIRIEDVAAFDLPYAGSTGTAPLYATGFALLGVGILGGFLLMQSSRIGKGSGNRRNAGPR